MPEIPAQTIFDDIEDAAHLDDEDETLDANIQTLRARWSMDGASTLAETAEQLRAFAAHLEQLAAEGWELAGPVEDDYGFAKRALSVAGGADAT